MTRLAQLLRDYFGHESETNEEQADEQINDQTTSAPAQQLVELTEATIYEIDPMIGMGKVTPYTFNHE